MASNFEYSVSYPFGVAELWALISSEQYWTALIQATNAELGSVESFTHDGNQVSVTTKQGVAAAELPSVVTAIHPNGVEIPRTIDFVLVGDQIIGQMSASVTGAPAKIQGDVSIMGEPATATYMGDCAVSIPFVGGKIEGAVIEQLRHLLDAERDATVEHHAAQ